MELMTDKHIDNFELIGDILNFDEPNSFYVVQVLKRKKENPDLKVNARTINIYYICNKDDLQDLKDRIVQDCLHNNARAYINLNRLDAYLVALHTQKIITQHLINGQLYAVKNAYATACGNLRSEEEENEENENKVNVINDDKKWLIDIDILDKDGNIDETQIELSDRMIAAIEELHKEFNRKNYKLIGKIPTKNGHHIITNPFNRTKFNKMFPGVTYYTNSPTILYV
jgi:hypothetical protein